MLHFFRAWISPQKLIDGLSSGTKTKNTFKSFGAIRTKIAFVENYKEYALCAILREKPTLGYTQRLKNVLHVVRCAKYAPQRTKNNANPSGLSEKIFIVWKVYYFVGKVEISFLRGVGGSLKKVLILVQRPQHKSTSDSVGAPKKIILAPFL